MYTTTLSAGAYTLRMQPGTSGVNAAVELLDAAGALLARNEDETSGSNNARLRAILPVGPYRVTATSVSPGQEGPYTLTLSASGENVTGCEQVYVAPGTATTQTLATTDCVDALAEGNYYEDHFLRRLTAGQQMTVSMSSSALDSYIIIADANGNEITFNDDKAAGTLDAEITFTAPSTGWYMIRASSSQVAQQGSYSLVIH
jgi:hypothetical protein